MRIIFWRFDDLAAIQNAVAKGIETGIVVDVTGLSVTGGAGAIWDIIRQRIGEHPKLHEALTGKPILCPACGVSSVGSIPGC